MLRRSGAVNSFIRFTSNLSFTHTHVSLTELQEGRFSVYTQPLMHNEFHNRSFDYCIISGGEITE